MFDGYGEYDRTELNEVYRLDDRVIILMTVYERDTAAEERLVRRGMEVARRLLEERRARAAKELDK
jgi:hypothetical protein